jgi:MSHA biogenesis protein MshL
VIVVRAMPQELRNVDAYLRAIRASVERQVMLEAKIVEVTLLDRYQTGINWAWFSNNTKAGNLVDPRTGGGMINPNTTLNPSGGANTSGNLNYSLTPGAASIAAGALPSLIPGVAAGSLFGLALQTANFSALLTFLESQGSVQVLSSPRIATLNNQKAVLKVGTDEFFITNISGGTTTSAITTGGITQFPTLTLRPFFSGVALDVTPQIDEDSSIILHIHPSVSNVQQDDREVNLGTVFGGAVTLPLARSTVSETDSVVRATDGNIVAIGGLMKVDLAGDNSGLPGAKDLPTVGGLFGSDRRAVVKKELVILIKPTVIQSDRDWTADFQNSRERFNSMRLESSRERFNSLSTGSR